MENKLETISNLFEGKEIRSIWDDQKEDYFFSVVDVISVLTDCKDSSDYWTTLKRRLINDEGSQLPTNCRSLKLKAKDGKMRNTDTLNTKGIFRLIESVPSPKAEPFKVWLANLGSERVDEVFNPEIAMNRAIDYYRSKGYSDEWIKKRFTGVLNRKKLTDVWQKGGINKPVEYAILTNEMYKTWSGMTASEYKNFKGIRKESLRDNMSDIELVLTDLSELTTREIATNENPQGLKENLSVAKRGSKASLLAKEYFENETHKKAVTSENNIGLRYIDEVEKIENK